MRIFRGGRKAGTMMAEMEMMKAVKMIKSAEMVKAMTVKEQ